MTNRRSGFARRHLIVLALYTLLSVLLTWPLTANIAIHVPGAPTWAFDEATFVWNIWQFKHAVVDNLTTPLHSDLIYYPLGIDLILYTYNFYHVLASLPLALATNLVVASNVSLLVSAVLSGYGTWLLVRSLLLRWERASSSAIVEVAPFLAGLVFAFASNRAVYAALGHYDMVTTQWIPFYALMLLRSLDAAVTAPQRRRAAALAGLFFAFNGLAEMITALFLAIFTLIVLLTYPSGEAGARSQQRVALFTPRVALPALLITGAVAFVVWSPALIPILIQFLTDDFSLKGWGEAIPLSVDLLGWFTPTALHPIFGGDLVQELRRVQLRALEMGVTGFRDINTVFLGWMTLAVAVIGALAFRRRVRLWIWTAVVFGLFTLGPFLQINGEFRFDMDGVEATFPLPYGLLHYLPIIKANRAPNRNSVVLMLALAVLVGYGVYWGWNKLTAWNARQGRTNAALAYAAAGVLAVALVFEHLAVPLPLSDFRIPSVYGQIAADPRPVSVLQVPLGWRNSFGVFGPEQTLLQYYQSAHGKPMLGGNISRAPDFKMDYFRRIPFFQALTEIEFGRPVDAQLIDAAKAQAAELMALYDVGYVLLYPPIPDKPPYSDSWQSTWQFIKETLPLEAQPFWREDGIEAYRVVQPQRTDRFSLDLGAAGTHPYRGEGWDAAETDAPYDVSAIWALGEESRLFIPLGQIDKDAEYTVTVRLHPFAYSGSPPQTATLQVNGRAVGGAQTLVDGWQEIAWKVAGPELVDGLNRLAFRWGYSAAPRTVVAGDRQIGATGVALPLDADLKGFADGGFIALFDEQGNQIDASAGRRGVNVTTLDPATGEVLTQAGFDTAANAFESDALAQALSDFAPGVIVLVVSHGDATAHLTEEAVEGLRAIGADVTLEEIKGNHFAIVGVKGAAPGAAAQVIDPTEAFLRISLNRDRRPLAAAVDWVRVSEDN
jgi:hypothetical protein